MSLFSRKKKEQTISVCTVTTGAVHIAFIKVFTHSDIPSLPVVLFSQSYPIVFRGETLTDIEIQITQLMKKGFEQGIASAGVVDRHVCMMNGPWVFTEQRLIHQDNALAVATSEKMIHDLVTRDEKKFQEDVANQEKHVGWGMIARGPIAVDINGYRVARLEKILARSVGISYTLGLAEARMVAMIVSVYEQVFHTDQVTFSALEYSFGLLQDADHWDHVVVCHVDGISSQLMMYKRGVMTVKKTCSVGIADIATNLAESFEVYEKHIPQVLSLHAQKTDHQDDVYHKRIMTAYQPMKKELESMMNGLLAQVHQIPTSVIITGLPQGFECFELLIAETLHKKQIHPTLDESLVMTPGVYDNTSVGIIGIFEALRHNH